nr:hypothetical protein [Tanacetum cinerariifolium]
MTGDGGVYGVSLSVVSSSDDKNGEVAGSGGIWHDDGSSDGSDSALDVGHTLEGVGLRVTDSLTGNHHRDPNRARRRGIQSESKDTRLSKFFANFKQQQSKVTNIIDTLLKVNNDRMMGALPSDTIKNPKLNVEDFGRFCVLDMEKDPMCPLLVGIGFLVIASAIIDCKKSKIVVGEGHTRPFFRVKENDFINTNAHGEWEIARDVELNPFKDVLVFRKMVEFLEDIPDYLNGNKWEMEDMFDDDWCWKNSPKKEMACGKLR